MKRISGPILSLTFLACVGCGPPSAQKQAQKLIEDVGGSAKLEEGEVVEVSLNNTSATDEQVRQIVAVCPNLRLLNLDATAVTDAIGLEVAKLTALEELWFARTKNITDAVLPPLVALTNLKKFNLQHVPVTDEGLATLAEMASLEELWINQSDITDAGLIELQKLPKLHRLDVRYTAVSDAAVPVLAEYPALRWLYVRETQITPEGAAELSRLNPELNVRMQ